MNKNRKFMGTLIIYYGILQNLHLITLMSAGVYLLKGHRSPFPVLPPPSGWQDQVWPFMFGLAGMDVVKQTETEPCHSVHL